MEIIDGQIHQPHIGGTRVVKRPPNMDITLSPEQELFLDVELAREAIDCVGVNKALIFAGKKFNHLAVKLYPDLFAACEVFDYAAEDLDEQMKAFIATPGMVATRVLFTNYGKVWRTPGGKIELNPMVRKGVFDRYFALANKHKIPVFIGGHEFGSEASVYAERFPELNIIIDHFGVTQSMLEPPENRWAVLPKLLAMARHPNVYVKLCGTPIISQQPFPYNDIWPHIHKILHAFGPERCLWASDMTRQRWGTETPVAEDGLPPRKDWIAYSKALDYILYTNELSASEKEWVLGKALRRAVNWPA